MKLNYSFLSLLFLSCVVSACSNDEKDEKPIIAPEVSKEIGYANRFAFDVLSEDYLWNKEISSDLKKLNPTNPDPIATVEAIRYKKNGKEIDKWTELTNNYEKFNSGFKGIEATYGYNLLFGKFENKEAYYLFVSYVYDNSPAKKAGLKRGDIIITLNGKDITKSNYMEAFNSTSITLGMGVLSDNKIQSGKSVSLSSVTMYSDPILAHKVFDISGKKVGYLAYSQFTQISIPRLIEICKDFKAQGVKELILDFRYNGGGSVTTENVLASMFAPESEVNARGLYQTEIWNDDFMEKFRQEERDTKTYFSTSFQIEDENNAKRTVSTRDANIGLNKIYGLVSSNTASASESLLIGLMPFMTVELIGENNTSGKYCTGELVSPSEMYKETNGTDLTPKEIRKWGMYVMINRYTDKNGNNPAMPDGLVPTITAADNALEGYELGDEREAMLKVALARAGKVPTRRTRSAVSLTKYSATMITNNLSFGKRVEDRANLKNK